MEVHELSFYSQFHCAMGDCPNTCCHGWQIVFDDETREKYRTKPGLTGIRLRHGITRHSGMTMFRNRRGSCPFLTKERLCGVQLALGDSYIPDVCRIFPRQRVNYGYFAEETLFLACPQAARIFLHNLGQLRFHTVEKEIDYARLGTNDDPAFLRELLGIRSLLVSQITDTDMPRARLYAGLLTYAGKLQQYYIRQAADNAEKPVCFEDTQDSFRITAAMTDAMMTGGFYHVLLRKTSPLLYRLCRMYFKEFDRLTGEEAEKRADMLRSGLSLGLPESERLLRSHLAYYLLLEFLSTYENYSFLRVVATGILHTHFLELLLALYYENTHSLTEDELIQIISAYDRRGRHCAEVEAGMYEVIAPCLRF